MPSRPAVSMMTTLCCRRRASSIDSRATCDRVADAVARLGGEHRHPGPLADAPAAAAPRWAAAGRPRPASACCPAASATARACRRAWSYRSPAGPASMITVGGTLANRSRRASPPRISIEFLVDDLDDLLRRVERRGHLFRRRALLDPGDELAHHGQRDVRLEQRDADLAGGRVDVGGGQPPAPAQEEKTWVSRSERVSNTHPRLSGQGHRVSAAGSSAQPTAYRIGEENVS